MKSCMALMRRSILSRALRKLNLRRKKHNVHASEKNNEDVKKRKSSLDLILDQCFRGGVLYRRNKDS
jgi:hypothetical protein